MGNPLFARYFDRFAGSDEERGQAELRRELLASLHGRVIEVGAGNGLNFRHYPATVTELVAVEPEPYLRRRATETARDLPMAIEVIDGTADRLPVPDGSFDAAVVSGVLCSVPDPAAALAELSRVLRPDSELRFYEHVRHHGGFGYYQDALDLVWPRLMGGCHPNRDTLSAVERAGYRLDHCRHLWFPSAATVSPVARRVIGAARRTTGARPH